jgi:hypothetical protein
MLTRRELAYAAWYIVLFAIIVGWAMLRPALRSDLPAPIMSGDMVGAPLQVTGREPEIRRVMQHVAR